MPPRTKNGSPELGKAIRSRRKALNLSIEEAANKAGIGTKTWGRYEAGTAIREDKVRGLCKALGWSKLPDGNEAAEDFNDNWLEEIDETHEAWSEALQNTFGRACAVVFAVGSDMMSDHTADDLAELALRPKGTHLGELGASWYEGSLPQQFVPRYDYEFVFALKCAVNLLRERFVAGNLVANTVIEELALYLIFNETDSLQDMCPDLFSEEDDWRDWLSDILEDSDIEFFLFSSNMLLTPRIMYHFDHWLEPQFRSEDDLTSCERKAFLLGTLISTNKEEEDD